MMFLLQYCNNVEFSTLTEEEQQWLVDDNDNGLGDSLEIYAPGCELPVDLCIASGMLIRDSLVAVDSLLEYYQPQFSVEAGAYDSLILLEITTSFEDAQIFYTVDGKEPDPQQILYESSILLDHSQSIKAATFFENERVSNTVIHDYVISIEGVASAPTFKPVGGVYFSEQRVTLETVTENSIIRYTTDGTEPNELSNGFNDPLVINRNLTIYARTYPTLGALMDPSVLVSAKYELKVATPEASLDSGTYAEHQKVGLFSSTGAEIHFTTDGTPPDALSELYVDSIEVNSSFTLKAKAFREGWTPSQELVKRYVIEIPGRVNDPVFSPEAGQYSESQGVTLTSSTEGALIYYTTDGSEPGESSEIYSNEISVDSNQLIKALAIKEGMENSGVVNGQFTFKVPKPTSDPKGGTYFSNQQVKLITPTQGATIYYSLDGSMPDTSSQKFSGSIFVDKSLGLNFRAFKPGWIPSDSSVEKFFINVAGSANNPIFVPSGGVFVDSVLVTLVNGTPDANLFYTLDGSKPDTNSLQYHNPIIIQENTELQAIAWHASLLPSSISKGTFSIKPSPPSVSPEGGEYEEPVWVKALTKAPDTLVRFTMDGTEPGDTSEVFPESLLVSQNTTLKVRIASENKLLSDVVTEVYQINMPVEVQAPVLNPSSSALAEATPITMTSVTVGATILYTLNGDDPGEQGSEGTFTYQPDSPPIISTNTTIKAKAILAGAAPSNIVTEMYTFTGVAKMITVSYPNGGESLLTGSQQTLTWSTMGSITTVNLEFLVGSDIISIAEGVENSGSYAMTMPGSPMEQVFFIVSDGSGVADTSDNAFSLVNSPDSSQFNWAKHAFSTRSVVGMTPIKDKNGNTYVAGMFDNNANFSAELDIKIEGGGGADLFLAKYNSLGNIIWAKPIGDRFLHDIALDQNFNIFISGEHNSQSFNNGLVPMFGKDDIFVAKYSTSGTLVWVQKSGGSDQDYGYSLATDKQGDVYVTGFVGSNSGDIQFAGEKHTGFGNDDIFVAKYSNGGTLVWSKVFGGPNNEYGFSIATDSEDNIWVTGSFFSDSISFGSGGKVLQNAGDSDIFLLKLNTLGAVLDVVRLGSTGFDEGADLATDANSNVYLTGSYTGTVNFGNNLSLTSTNTSVFILKVNSNQVVDWVKSIQGAGELLNPVLSVGPAGNGMIMGKASGSLQFGDNSINLELAGNATYLASFQNGGAFLWAMELAGAIGSDLYTGSQGTTVITGSYSGRPISLGPYNLPMADATNMFITDVNNVPQNAK